MLDGLSFDLLFRTRFARQPTEVVMVSLDGETFEELQQPKRAPLNRTDHAQLIERLAAAGARAVVFDMVFDDALAAQDDVFAPALKKMPCVIGAEHFRAKGGEKERLVLPVPALRTVTNGWGLVNLDLQGAASAAQSYRLWENVADLAVDVPQGRAPWLALRAWEAAGDGRAGDLRAPQRIWLNFYGSRDTIATVSYSQALDPKREPDKTFAGKIVFVGSGLTIGNPGATKDEFATPYSLFDHSAMRGVEIHATAYLNLVRNEWLTRTPMWIERTGIVLLAAIFGALFIGWPPYRGLLIAILAAVFVVVLAWYCFVWQHAWFVWVKVVVVIAAAYGWRWFTIFIASTSKTRFSAARSRSISRRRLLSWCCKIAMNFSSASPSAAQRPTFSPTCGAAPRSRTA
jgi:CHASE2 domain-containing sensor protein